MKPLGRERGDKEKESHRKEEKEPKLKEDRLPLGCWE
jgi:hypothetical protein